MRVSMHVQQATSGRSVKRISARTVLIHLTWGWLQTTLKRKDPKNILVQIYQYGIWIKMAVIYKFPFPCRQTLQGQWLCNLLKKVLSMADVVILYYLPVLVIFFRDFNISYSFKGGYRSCHVLTGLYNM